jgi:hypothetical protein
MRRTIKRVRRSVVKIKYAFSPKVFCIGRNKTGTTSMAALFRQLGFTVAPQRPFELLIHDWHADRYDRIIRGVKYKGNAFQDVPFSLPKTYKILDQHFPKSKFILTIRNSEDDWYQSLVRFHSKIYSNGSIPTKEDLQNAKYIYKGWAWEMYKMTKHTPEDDIYNEKILKRSYLDYNRSVMEYFSDKPGKLLIVNLKEPEALDKICSFLDVEKTLNHIPWENRTQPKI